MESPATASSTPAPRIILGSLESAFTATGQSDGWMRFDVQGARGPSPPYWVFIVGPMVGMMVAGTRAAALQGCVFGFVMAFVAFVLRMVAIGRYANLRAPAGTVWAGPEGIKLRSDLLIRTADIDRLVRRNVQDGRVISGRASDLNAFSEISYQIEVQTGGRTYPVVGSMTDATSSGVYTRMLVLLGFTSVPV